MVHKRYYPSVGNVLPDEIGVIIRYISAGGRLTLTINNMTLTDFLLIRTHLKGLTSS